MSIFLNILKPILLFSMIISCSSNSEPTQDDEFLELNNLKSEIEQLVTTGNCTETNDCDYIAFGSKPCGGPWSYLIYSTSIDVELLLQKVEFYNNKEQAYNLKWSVISDCAFVLPPTTINCENGNCIAIFE